jgi:hypothetical protein
VIDPAIVNQVQEEIGFFVYPNPSSNQLYINYIEGNITSVKVFDITGKIVYENDFDTKLVNIDVSQFSDGVYAVEVFANQKKYWESVIFKK